MMKVTARAFCRSIGPKKGEPFLLEKGVIFNAEDVADLIRNSEALGNAAADLLQEYGSEGIIINFTFDNGPRMG